MSAICKPGEQYVDSIRYVCRLSLHPVKQRMFVLVIKMVWEVYVAVRDMNKLFYCLIYFVPYC